MDFCCVGLMRPRGESATSANRGSRDNQQTDRSRRNQVSAPSFDRRARPHTRAAAAARLSDFGIVEQSRSAKAIVFCETGESKAASIDAGICLLESPLRAWQQRHEAGVYCTDRFPSMFGAAAATSRLTRTCAGSARHARARAARAELACAPFERQSKQDGCGFLLSESMMSVGMRNCHSCQFP
jgi:hypothetical protein